MSFSFDSVSALVHRIRSYIAGEFDDFSVKGEISNLYRAASGHYYFTLKDSDAQIKCAWFRPGKKALVLDEATQNGQEVLISGRLDLYPPQGSIQVILSAAEIVGSGDLNAQFDALYKKLSEAGYFNDDHKISLPQWPQTIGIATSTAGAALRDIISVFSRRYPQAKLIIAPTKVQGVGSEKEIASAVRRLDSMNLDAIIIGRGGGSIEDLWSFNEEIVVKAVYDCTTPIISGVGHETDVSLCDLAADVRAATPTAAAETLSPDTRRFSQQLDALEKRLIRDVNNKILIHRQRLDSLEAKIVHPRTRITLNESRLKQLSERQIAIVNRRLNDKKQSLNATSSKIISPHSKLNNRQQQLERQATKLQFISDKNLAQKRNKLAILTTRVNTLSPERTLERGFSIISDKAGRVVSQSTQIQSGDAFSVQMHDGQFDAHRD